MIKLHLSVTMTGVNHRKQMNDQTYVDRYWLDCLQDCPTAFRMDPYVDQRPLLCRLVPMPKPRPHARTKLSRALKHRFGQCHIERQCRFLQLRRKRTHRLVRMPKLRYSKRSRLRPRLYLTRRRMKLVQINSCSKYDVM